MYRRAEVPRSKKEKDTSALPLLPISSAECGKIYCAVTMKPNIIFILGLPGAGKGTQSKKIVEHYNFAHLSAGDLLREELNNPNSVHRDVIKQHFDSCTIVPVEITCQLINQRMTEISATTGTWNFLIDGFPRNWDNFHGWQRTMSTSTNLLFVLYLKAPEVMCVDRCLNRCDGSGRTDDNLECLKKRVLNFRSDTLPVINHYMEIGKLEKMDAAKSPDEVFDEIKILLEASLPKNNLFRNSQDILTVNNNSVSFD